MTRLILVMLFAFSGLLHAQTAVNTKILDQCFDFEPWIKNDYNVIAARMFDAVQNSPDDIATLTYINHFGHTLFYTDNPDALGKTLLAITGDAKRLGVLGLNARALLGLMHEAALIDDDLETARRIETATLGLQQWLVAGPFGANDGDRHYDVLQPELWVDTKQTMSGAFGPVSWTKWTPELPSRSTVNPQDVFEHDGTGWFLLTQVVNDGDAFEALLDIEVNDGGVKVWLNGSMVFNRRPEADLSRDDSALVQIPKGTSTLLVKLGSLSAATVRICDPKTRLSLESVRSQYPTDMKPFAPRGSVPPASQPIPYRYQRLAALIESAKDPKVQMQARCLLALELLEAQSPEQAEDLWHEAEGYRKSHPLMEACLDAMYYERTSVATAAEQRRILAERYTWLNANQPGAVVSRLKLANIRVGEDRDGDARKLYDETLAIQPHWAHRTHYAAFFDRRKWQAEARNQRMLAFTETSSRPAQLVLMRAEMAEADGDLELAQELYEQLADGPAKNNTNILDALKRLALNSGDFDTAIEYIEAKERILGGTTTATQRERAAILAASGKIAEAFAILMALAERPERGRANRYYDAAMLAYRNGLEKEAREALLKTVERNPGHDNARRYLARLDGKAPQMLSEFSTALDPLQARDWLKAQDYPLASAGWLLDEEVWHVEKDGSFVAYGQTVTKILLQDAVDTHGRQRIDGEVLRARTIKGDGTELEPVTVTGANFEFPGVEPGAVIDTAYRRYTRASTPGVLDDVSFQFEDRDVRTPTALARLVVVTPKDFVVHYREENMEGATFTRRELDDGRVLLSWEMRRPRSRKAEPAMPTRDETMPKVTFYRPGENPWTGAARRLRSSLRATEVTWRVREAAMQALSVLDRDAGDIQKAVALYAWVNSTIRTTGGGTNPHTTVEQKSGDRFALMAAMLDAAGVEYKHVFAGNDPDIETRKPRYLDYADMLRSRLLLIEDEGEQVFIDMTYRLAPFGELESAMFEAPAMAIDPASGAWTFLRLPGGDESRDRRGVALTLKLAADGSATVTGNVTDFGAYGYDDREQARTATPNDNKRALEQTVGSFMPGISIGAFELVKVEELGVPFLRTFDASMASAAQKTEGDGLRFTPHLTNTGDVFGRYISEEHRAFDLVISDSIVFEETLRYELPEGYRLERMPEDVAIPAHPFLYSLTYSLDGGTLTVKRSLRTMAARIDVENYASFRTHVKTAADAERRALVLIPE